MNKHFMSFIVLINSVQLSFAMRVPGGFHPGAPMPSPVATRSEQVTSILDARREKQRQAEKEELNKRFRPVEGPVNIKKDYLDSMFTIRRLLENPKLTCAHYVGIQEALSIFKQKEAILKLSSKEKEDFDFYCKLVESTIKKLRNPRSS